MLLVIVCGGLKDLTDPWVWALLVVAAATIVRSCFFGVRIRQGKVYITSWLRTYRVSPAEVEDVLAGPYVGLLTRGVVDPLLRNAVGILGFAERSGRERFYPVTVMRMSSAISLAERIAAEFRAEVRWVDEP